MIMIFLMNGNGRMGDAKVLILGGRGMLGADLVKTCEAAGIKSRVLDLPEFDITDIGQLKVTDARTSGKILRAILTGKESGPRKDIVVLNAAAAIIAAGLAKDFASAIELAQSSIADGRALACLENLVEVSNRGS